jgi:hypothetical protein
MPARFVVSGTVLTLFVLLPASKAQDAKNKAPENSSSSATIDASTLQSGEYFGKLVGPPGKDGSFSLRIDKLEPKDAAAAKKAADELNAAVQYAKQMEQQVSANATPQRVNALQKAYERVRKEQARQRGFYNVTYKEIDIHAASDLTVRFAQPPVIYDDKGERKKFTQAELIEMRGSDPSVPGFAAKTSDLQAGQVVRVSLRPVRPASATATPPAAATTSDKDKDKDKDKPAPKMEATMLVIMVAEDTTAIDPNYKEPAKKKGK